MQAISLSFVCNWHSINLLSRSVPELSYNLELRSSILAVSMQPLNCLPEVEKTHTMDINVLLQTEVELLDETFVRQLCLDLQKVIRESQDEIATFKNVNQLQNKELEEIRVREKHLIKQLQDQDESISYAWPRWFQAEQDYPDDTSGGCFGRQSPAVVVYDFRQDVLSKKTVESLEGEQSEPNATV